MFKALRAAAIGTAVIVAAGAALFAACSSGTSVHRSDVVGVYEAHYKSGVELLTLSDDGTYVQEVTVDDTSTRVVHSGSWTYHGSEVELDRCLDVNAGFGEVRSDFATPITACYLPTSRRWFFFFGPV